LGVYAGEHFSNLLLDVTAESTTRKSPGPAPPCGRKPIWWYRGGRDAVIKQSARQAARRFDNGTWQLA
jgi:hypothetical protein